MIITLANAKGGVAKTTSAIYIAAAHLLRTGRLPVVLDADPQASASLWADLAEQQGEPLGFDVGPANPTTLARLRRAGAAGLYIVDAPPQGPVLKAALDAADLVIVPASDGPLDLQQAWLTISSLPASTPALVLLARAEPSTTCCRTVIESLAQAHTPRFDTVIRKRQDIKRCMGRRPRKLWEYAALYNDEILPLLKEAAR